MSERLENIAPADKVSNEVINEVNNPRRHIRSFVLRQGRVSNAQLRYYETMMAEIGVPYVAAPLDLESLFGLSLIHI